MVFDVRFWWKRESQSLVMLVEGVRYGSTGMLTRPCTIRNITLSLTISLRRVSQPRLVIISVLTCRTFFSSPDFLVWSFPGTRQWSSGHMSRASPGAAFLVYPTHLLSIVNLTSTSFVLVSSENGRKSLNEIYCKLYLSLWFLICNSTFNSDFLQSSEFC